MKKKGFTLIEILIAVTLSAILMTSIIVFLSGSLGANMTTKKNLEDGNKNERFEQNLTLTLGNTTGSGFYATGASFGGGYLTGIFLRTESPNLPITFLGLKTETGYCDSYTGTADATGTVQKLALRQFTVPTEQNTTSYILSSAENVVFSGTDKIIGTGYMGNSLDTTSGALTELSSPSALISSGNYLYVADTMNDRVLSYDTTTGGIIELLGRKDGIRKPISLYFSGNILLIASSGNGKIYSLQDGDIGDGSIFSSTFQVANAFQADTIRFTFPGIPSIISPTIPGDFSFVGVGVSQNIFNDIITTGTSLQYTFTGGLQSFAMGTPYIFKVSNISTPPTTPRNHIVQIDFLSGTTVNYSDTFHYFSKGDGTLESNTGNILKVISEGNIFPYNITGNNTWDGDTIIDWTTVLAGNPRGTEIISHFPVQDLEFQKNGNILTIRYHEYTHYDCILEKHQVEERIWKILLPE